MAIKSKIQQLGRDSIIYGIGGMLSRVVTLIMLPIYTRLFSPTDYGIIEMLTVISSLFGSVLIMGMDSAQSYFFFEQKNNGKAAQIRVISAILQWRLTWGLVVVISAIAVSPIINSAFFNSHLSWEYFVIVFVGILFTQVMTQSAEVFRLLYRPISYIGITLAQAILSAAIGVIAVVYFKMGVFGYFIGIAVASLIAGSIGWWLAREYMDWSKWYREWWPRLLRFGAPLVPGAFAVYVMNTADRWFIMHFLGEEAMGIYAVGAKFALLLMIAITTFRQAWWPIAMDAMHSADGPHLFRTLARIYLGITCAGVVLLTALSPLLVSWLTTPDYYDAYPIVGVLAWHVVFYGFYLISAAGLWKSERTYLMPLLVGIAAVFNIILDYYLVPLIGTLGAALATSLSFGLWNVLTLWVSERLWPVHYHYGVAGLQVFIGVTTTAGILYLYKAGFSVETVLFTTVFAVLLLLSTITRLDYLDQVYKKLIKVAKSA